MVCIYCGGPTKVNNSRLKKRPNAVWRRRQCLSCGSIITTEETACYDGSLTVRRPSGALEPFQSDKLLISIYKSLAHRPGAAMDAGALTNTVIALLLKKRAGTAELSLQDIKNAVATCLARFDVLADSHYRAYHPN